MSAEVRQVNCKDLSPEMIVVLEDCKGALCQFEQVSRNPLSSDLFRLNILLRVSQNLILIEDAYKLRARWTTIQKRLAVADEGERKIVLSLDDYKNIKSYFEMDPSKSSASADLVLVRNALRNVKLYFDERTSLKVWSASDFRSRTYSLMLLVAVLGVGLGYSLSSSALVLNAYWMAIAGALGGALRGIASPSTAGAPVPDATSILLRPVLGAVSGLVLYIMILSKLIIMDSGLALFFAIALGFSDSWLTKVLSDAAKRLSDDAVKSVGQQPKSKA